MEYALNRLLKKTALLIRPSIECFVLDIPGAPFHNPGHSGPYTETYSPRYVEALNDTATKPADFFSIRREGTVTGGGPRMQGG